MKWLIIGDVHGQFKAFNYNLNRIEGKVDYDLIVQLGDFGFWKDILQRSKRKFPEMCKRPIYFVRGNHEEYSRDKRGKQKGPFFKDYEGIIVPSYFEKCKHVPRYINDELIKIGNLKVLGIGGARSTDREYRVLGLSWWKEEEVDTESVERAIIEKWSPDVIISHDVPTQFFEYSMFKGSFKNRAGDAQLGRLYECFQPRFWFFGHYHTQMEWKDSSSGTEFVCLPEWNKGYGIFDDEFMEFERYHWK